MIEMASKAQAKDEDINRGGGGGRERERRRPCSLVSPWIRPSCIIPQKNQTHHRDRAVRDDETILPARYFLVAGS